MHSAAQRLSRSLTHAPRPLAWPPVVQVLREDEVVWRIPRSREVGQSYLAALLPTARAFAASASLLLAAQPDLLLCNGPGTCLPLCATAAALRCVGLLRTRIVFVESVCRVTTLSLTGRLLYPFVDQVQVQWPALLER